MVTLNPNIKLLKIKDKQVDSLKIKGKLAYMHSTPYTVRTTEELEYALNNVKDGETINIKAGTYTLTKRYDIPTCTINGAGTSNTIIKNYAFGFTSGTSTANVSNIKFDGNGVDRGDAGMIYLATQTNSNIHDCHFTNMIGKWNCHGIRIATTSSSKTINIYNNTFDGSNNITSYGHTNASIAGFHLSTIYNVKIYSNTFNHPSGGYSPAHNAKAIALFDGSNPSTLNNCIAICNTYSGTGDSNYGITETTVTSYPSFSYTCSVGSLSDAWSDFTFDAGNTSVTGKIELHYRNSSLSKTATLSNGKCSFRDVLTATTPFSFYIKYIGNYSCQSYTSSAISISSRPQSGTISNPNNSGSGPSTATVM